jgi:hypothetical protein
MRFLPYLVIPISAPRSFVILKQRWYFALDARNLVSAGSASNSKDVVSRMTFSVAWWEIAFSVNGAPNNPILRSRACDY